MTNIPPDPQKRSLFDILRDPERFGRELGRAYRELRDVFNPPTVPRVEYEQAVNRIDALETQIKALETQHTKEQGVIQHLALQGVEQDKKLSEIINILQNSALSQDKEQLTHWQNLRKHLWMIVASLLGIQGALEALRDVAVQEAFWPLMQQLPSEVQALWQDFFKPAQAQGQPISPLPSPLPTSPDPIATRQPNLPTPQPVPEPPGQRPTTPTPDTPHFLRGTALQFDWVTIPAGEFLMGSDKDKDKLAFGGEMPQHRLYLPTYAIARTPVTVAQFAQFVRATNYQTTAEKQGSNSTWMHPRGPQSDVKQKSDHPVTCVSWHDAMAFCQWASEEYHRSGQSGVIRLPTEAEWEKAARGTDGRIYLWGNEAPDKIRCNFNMNEGDTTPINKYGKVGASVYGVWDVAGNVWEWTGSLYKPYPYKKEDGREEAEGGDGRVLRGGSFFYDEFCVRCACRHLYDPDLRFYYCGFRVCLPRL